MSFSNVEEVNVFYTSFGETTARFVHDKLRVEVMKQAEAQGKRIEYCEVRLEPDSIHSSIRSPHFSAYIYGAEWGPGSPGSATMSCSASKFEFEVAMRKYLTQEQPAEVLNIIVTPTYGSMDRIDGQFRYAPRCLKDTASILGAGNYVLGVSGNRTFGKEFAASAEEFDGPQRTVIFELDGYEKDAIELLVG